MPESDQRLFFLLQRAAHRLRLDADRRCMDAAGITTAQLGALFAIQSGPDGLTQRELARVLGLRESAVTSLAARLAAAGLVTRGAHPDEHRAVVLRLSDGGRAALHAARPALDAFNAELRSRLGDEGFAQVSAALRTLAYDD